MFSSTFYHLKRDVSTNVKLIILWIYKYIYTGYIYSLFHNFHITSKNYLIFVLLDIYFIFIWKFYNCYKTKISDITYY